MMAIISRVFLAGAFIFGGFVFSGNLGESIANNFTPAAIVNGKINITADQGESKEIISIEPMLEEVEIKNLDSLNEIERPLPLPVEKVIVKKDENKEEVAELESAAAREEIIPTDVSTAVAVEDGSGTESNVEWPGDSAESTENGEMDFMLKNNEGVIAEEMKWPGLDEYAEPVEMESILK